MLRLLLVIFYLNELIEGQSYTSLSFQEDGVFDSQSAKDYARLGFDFPDLDKFTICTWIKLHYHRLHNQLWSYCAKKNAALVCSGLGNEITIFHIFD